jgi:hypothetical protein
MQSDFWRHDRQFTRPLRPETKSTLTYKSAMEFGVFGIFGFVSLPSHTAWHKTAVSTKVDGDFKTSVQAVGIDRNDAAKLTKRSGRRWRMSKSLAFGESAKGHRSRPVPAFELPVHQEGPHSTFP